ncbi:MAG: peptidylprolyl isomerase, partial [Ignavibacteria bacterium]|nr:peptidylprolyl isomerase [Ignavibacteria bacterium]
LGNKINEPFIFIDKDKFSVKEFLDALLFHGFIVQDTSIEYLRRRLNSRIKSFIEDEFLAIEGKRQNLDKLPEVQSDLSMWKDFYRNISFNSEFKKEIQVEDKEVESYFKSHSSEAQTMVQVNILEILVDSLEQVEMLLKKISDGENFSDLARKFSKRKWAAEKGGEFGFFPTSMYAEIGEVASKMKIGEIYAPLKTNDGYSIIKLIDKKVDSVSNLVNYDEVKEKIRTNIFNKKFFEKKNKFIAQLAEKYIKKINYDLLNSIKTTSLNMFAYRFMGFGGRITAVPLLTRYTEWFDEWMKLKQQVP